MRELIALVLAAILLVWTVASFSLGAAYGAVPWGMRDGTAARDRQSPFPAPMPPFQRTEIYRAKEESKPWAFRMVRVSADGGIYFVRRRAEGAYLIRLSRAGEVEWEWRVPSASSPAELAVDQRGWAYLATDQMLYAIEPSGALGWSVPLDGSPPGCPHDLLVATNGDIVLGQMRWPYHDTSLVLRISPAGYVRWRYEARHCGRESFAPVVASSREGTVYVAMLEANGTSECAHIDAISAEGSRLWTFTIPCEPFGYRDFICSREGRVAVPFDYGNAVLMLSARGEPEWIATLGSGRSALNGPCADAHGNLVFYSVLAEAGYDWTSEMVALSGSDGSIVWRRTAQGDHFDPAFPATATSDGFVLSGMTMRRGDVPGLECFNAEGQVVWRHPLPTDDVRAVIPLDSETILVSLSDCVRAGASVECEDYLVILERDSGFPLQLRLYAEPGVGRPGGALSLFGDLRCDSQVTTDVYLAVLSPTGQLLFAPSFGSVATPLFCSQSFQDGTAIREFPLLRSSAPAIPNGLYTWYLACTYTGTMDLASNIASCEWEFEK